MHRIVYAKAVQISPPTQFDTARQIPDFAKPLLKFSIIIMGIFVLPKPMIGGKSFNILTRPERQPGLKSLERPPVGHRVVVAAPQFVAQLRRSPAIHAIKVKMRKQHLPQRDSLASKKVRWRGGGWSNFWRRHRFSARSC